MNGKTGIVSPILGQYSGSVSGLVAILNKWASHFSSQPITAFFRLASIHHRSMSQDYKKVEGSFKKLLEELVAKKPFIRIQYFSDIREFITTTAMPKELFEQDGAEYLGLATGEVIRLDRLVRIGDKAAPGYSEDYFKCDI